MTRDMQYDILDPVRQAGYSDSGVLSLSRLDAEYLIRGLPDLDATATTPEDLNTYAGTRDVAGVATYRLDDALQPGTAHLEGEDGVRIPIVVQGI